MRPEGTVFVIDDDPGVRASLVRLLQEVGLRVKTYASADEFQAAYQPGEPGCLVLDLRMPVKSGTALYRELRASQCDLPVIIVTAHGDVELAVEMIRFGVFDFLEKPFKAQTLIDRIHEALERNAEARRGLAERARVHELFALLSEREREVVDLAVEGLSNKEIAARLGVTPQAIDSRRAKAMHKLGVSNIPALVKLAQVRASTPPSEAEG